MKRLAASKAPWPSWEFKQEQARMKRSFWPAVDCLLGDSQPYGHQMLSATFIFIYLFLVQGAAGFPFFCHMCRVCVCVCVFVCVCLSGKNCFNSVLLQDQFSFCNHTMLGDIRAAKLCQSPLFGLYLFDSLVFRIDRHEIAIPGRVCCRWHSVFHRGWAQADVGVCSYMGGLNLGHWTLWPSRTLEIMESKSAVGSTSKTFLTNCPLIFCGKPAYQHIMNKSGIRNYCYQHLLMKSNHPVSPTPVTSL